MQNNFTRTITGSNPLSILLKQEETNNNFGVNIHRSHQQTAMTRVDKWSAGCQVFQDPEHFAFFLKLCDIAAAKYGNSFTYTLLTEEDY
ncbi:MAG: hypothetical protein OEV78_12490 [Spirochaetia bacterium]|nr:hypothetical protein [Spirochaetia bacterium]